LFLYQPGEVMPFTESRNSSSEGVGHPPSPTEIDYYLGATRGRSGDGWKGLALLAVFLSALALCVAVVAVVLAATGA